MAGSVVLTGANGSAGLHAAEHLVKAYPEYTAILTVRSTADNDVNTNALRSIISKFPDSKVSIHEVDLADLAAVHRFTTTLADDIANGKCPPIKAIICNAFYWNLVSDPELTVDGLDKTMQVSFVSHALCVLRLIDKFDQIDGRVELISSVAHFRRKTPMSQYIPGVPSNLDELVHPHVDNERRSHGMLRYSNSKLDPKLSHITAVAINPGDSADSRAFRTNTPTWIRILFHYVLLPLRPIYRRLVDPTWRPSAEAGVDMVELAVNKQYKNERGYYTLLERTEPDEIVKDEDVQDRIWKEAAKWAGVDKGALAAAFE
ncbi:putative short-chain dehydrogenase [Lophiostoma macrostomum CBS 122681]|uniref:3beta-hydroxysteroid 3-dehydrogenase n=1 Tax=Lophiostoma macrostomum CBS 122681 TaxID=1314788 RepID=A0A6A6SMT4_9PLEO|nr:putative short-chain dehydrogenase [Lophiostoma macrostomum CBS 122681]